jgi:hypothetical protein
MGVEALLCRAALPKYAIQTPPAIFQTVSRRGSSLMFAPCWPTELAVDRYFRLAVDQGVQRDHHPDRGAGVRSYFGAVQLKDEIE